MASAIEDRRINIYINGKEVRNNMKSIRTEFYSANAAANKATRGSKKYIEATSRVKQLKAIMQQHSQNLKGVSKGWAKMKDIMLGVIGGNIVLNAFQRLTSFIPQLIEGNAKLSDSFADVQKNADLTNEEMEMLYKNLKGIDTRTKNSQLLELAAAAGKSGVRGVQNLTEVVRQLDQVQVALGDDLGDNAALDLQKIAANFNTEILNIGSGINALSDSTKANAGFLKEWITRLSGSAKQVNVTAGEVLGYGTVLDELGLKVEMSSTALNGFFIDFTKNTDKFGRVAGFAEGELRKLIGEEGTNAGFLAFLEKLKESSTSAEDFLKKLEAVGVTGDRGSQVFLALSQNIDQLRQRQQDANKAIEEGTSITNEYNKRNDNLAGQLERISKWMNALWTNSAMKSGIEYFVKKAAEWVKIPTSQKLKEEYLNMNTLVNSITDVNIKQDKRIKLIQQLQDNYGDYIGNIDAETISNAELVKAMELVNDQLLRKIVIQTQKEKIEAAANDAAEDYNDLLERRQLLEEKLTQIGLNKGLDLTNKSFAERVAVVEEALKKEARFNESVRSGTTSALNQEARDLMAVRVQLEQVNAAKARYTETQQEFIEVSNTANSIIQDQEKGLIEEEAILDENIGTEENPKIIEDYVAIRPIATLDKKGLEDFQNQLDQLNEEYLNATKELNGTTISTGYANEIDEAIPDFDSKLDATINYYEGLLVLAETYGYREQEVRDALDKLQAQKDKEVLQEKARKFEEFYQKIQGIANIYFDYMAIKDQERIDSLDKEETTAIKAVQAKADNEVITERQAKLEQEKIEENYARKKAKIKERQFKQKQTADIISIVANTAVAVMETYAELGYPVGIPAALLVGAEGAAQAALVASQKPPKYYARGVFGSPSTTAIVGEQGPEIVQLPAGSNVYTNPQTEDLLSPAVNPSINVSGNEFSTASIIREELGALRQEMRAWKTRIRGDWRMDEFDQVQEREKIMDSLVNLS